MRLLSLIFVLLILVESPVAESIRDLVGSAEDEVILREVGSELWTCMTGVAIQGNYAYCNMRYGLLILDISLPADGAKSLGFSPTYVSKVRLPGSTFDAAVSGDYVYVGGGSAGMLIIDVSEPSAPFIATSYNTPGYAGTSVIASDLAYVADSDSGLLILDITYPTEPEIVGSFPCSPPNAIAVLWSAYVLVRRLLSGTRRTGTSAAHE